MSELEERGPSSITEWISHLTQERGFEKSICPSEVARAFRPKKPGEVPGKELWRSYMRQVRAEAIGLARKGEIDILRKGQPIDPQKPFKGVYRLRLKGGVGSR